MAVIAVRKQPFPLGRTQLLSMTQLLALAPLLAILLLQAAASLSLHNSAFMDEALYLDVGRYYFDHLLGGPAPPDWTKALSGLPYLYPLLAGAIDHYAPTYSWGLEAARCLSLGFMLFTTTAVYALTERLFDRDSGLLAAALFASQASIQFLGHFATYDAMSLALLALATVLAYYVSTARRFYAAPLVGVALLLAVGTKYVALMFVPTVVAILAWQTLQARGWRSALWRTGMATAVVVVGAMLALRFLDQTIVQYFYVSSFHRGIPVVSSRPALAETAALLGGGLLALGVVGLVLRSRARLPLRIVLLGSGLLAPAYHLYTNNPIALHKHIGFGLFFVAPLAGYAVARLSGYGRRARIGRRWLVALAVCLVAFNVGAGQAQGMYDAGWPNSDAVIHVLRTQVRPGTTRILVDEQEVIRYYLRDLVSPQQYSDFYYFGYKAADGRYLSGVDAYRAAIADGYFDLLVFSYRSDLARTVHALDGVLRRSTCYQLLARIPFSNIYHSGNWWVWRKRPAGCASPRASHSAKEQRPTITPTAAEVSPAVLLNPDAVSFGPQHVGTTCASYTVHLVNLLPTRLTVTHVSITGDDAGDFGEADTCAGRTIGAYDGCTVKVRFTPRTRGLCSASLVIADDAAGGFQAVPLSGPG